MIKCQAEYDEEFFKKLWEWFTDKTKKGECGKENKPELYYFAMLDEYLLAVRRSGKNYQVVGHNLEKKTEENLKPEQYKANYIVYGTYKTLNEAIEEFYKYLHKVY